VVLLAGDEVVELAPGELTAEHFRGGTDNLPALEAAWDRIAAQGDARGLVVWVHAPQPVALGSTDGLAQRCERRPGGPRLVALATGPGPNRVLDALDGCPWLVVAPRRGDLAADLGALLAGHPADGATLVARRERIAAGANPPAGVETSAHLARLWARNEVARLAAPGADPAAAAALAVKHRLVTPLSGAVVLETVEQYAAADLQPGSPEGVPTIPEPATTLLVAVAAVLLGLAALRRRRWGAAGS
jgi:hypothetical protein